MRNEFEKAKAAYGTGAYDDATLEFLFPELKEPQGDKILQTIEDIIRFYGKTQGEWLGGLDMDTLVFHLREAFEAKNNISSPKLTDLELIGQIIGELKANQALHPLYYVRYETLIEYLQNLLRVSHWKPSEEQMNHLELAIDNTNPNSVLARNLQSLYNDLKKL